MIANAMSGENNRDEKSASRGKKLRKIISDLT
jgi:hypothetical protein